MEEVSSWPCAQHTKEANCDVDHLKFPRCCRARSRVHRSEDGKRRRSLQHPIDAGQLRALHSATDQMRALTRCLDGRARWATVGSLLQGTHRCWRRLRLCAAGWERCATAMCVYSTPVCACAETSLIHNGAGHLQMESIGVSSGPNNFVPEQGE